MLWHDIVEVANLLIDYGATVGCPRPPIVLPLWCLGGICAWLCVVDVRACCAQVAIRDAKSATPLHHAAMLSGGMCKLLLEKRADLMAKAENDWTPIHLARHSVCAIQNSTPISTLTVPMSTFCARVRVRVTGVRVRVRVRVRTRRGKMGMGLLLIPPTIHPYPPYTLGLFGLILLCAIAEPFGCS